MNCLPHNVTARTSGSNQVAVSLVTTETSILANPKGNSSVSGLTVEESLHRRAETMTDVLTEIMDRPVAQRFWGLNE